ncbi:MAG: nuclear transport factor 2 family protein [Bacteroidetes bacterium]|nr:nuclear transport factor 2 family protein [Bacteroidota bacterium]MDA1122103.1 nuclear transport factor 2 family protein [Bacteroidota bacterium]
MKKLTFIPFILMIACQPAPPPCECGITGNDKVQIRDQEQAFVKAIFEADQNLLATIFDDQIVAMPPNEGEIHGRNAYVTYLSKMPSVLEFEFLEVEIEGGDDHAFAKGNYVMTLEVEGAEISDEGSFVEIWKKMEKDAGSFTETSGTQARR